MRSFLDDIRFGLRLLAKSPVLTAAVVVVLALGIGANTAIFTIVDAVLIRPLPYRNSEQLVMMYQSEPEIPKAPVTGPDFQDWKKMARSFQDMAAGTSASFNLTGAGEPMRLDGWAVTPNLFDLLGVHPALGRAFQAGEDHYGRNRVAVITYSLWQRAFGGDAAIVGRDITLDGQNVTVIGVMPPQFRFASFWAINAQLFVPLSFNDPGKKWLTQRGNHGLWTIGRMKPGVTVEQADAELKTISRQLEKAYPDSNERIGGVAVGMHEQLTGRSRGTLLALLIAVAFVLAIACANVANLMIAQSTRRHREMAVRLALGATAGRLLRQLLTESLVVSFLGAGLGLLLAVWLQELLLKLGPAGYVPSIADVRLNGDVFVFTAGLALLTGLVSGLMPAWQASRTEIHDAMKEGGRSTSTGTRTRFRNGLIVAEVASTLMLLFAAGLTLRSLRQVLAVNLAFDGSGVLTMKLSLPDARYRKPEDAALFFTRALEAVRAVPGVQAAGFTSELPLEGGNNGGIRIEGRPRTTGWGGALVENGTITPGYLSTLRIPLLAGRDVTDADIGKPVALINSAMAKQFWGTDNPLGHRFGSNDDHPVWYEVVGVVGDVPEWGIESRTIPQRFQALGNDSARSTMSLAVRTTLPPESLAKPVADAIHSVDKLLPLYEVQPMQAIVDARTGERRFNVFLLGLFAGLALLLAAVGIYGVMSSMVAQRTQEIGLRMALGAHTSHVLGMVLGQSLRLIMIGVILGTAGALASSRLLAALVFRVKPDDPLTIAAGAGALLLVALLASYLPARRAAKVDPMVALRYE